MTTPAVILASASAARTAMLQAAGVAFTAIPADVDEAAIKSRLLSQGSSPEHIANTLAETKAAKIASDHSGDLVIGADQVLAADAQMFDKPVDIAAAHQQLRQLAGRDHTLHSAVCLVRGDTVVWRHAATATLTMRDISNDFLDQYLSAMGQSVCDTVGGYQIEGLGAQLFSHITGDYFTILGMPLLPLLDSLRANGVLLS